MSQSQIELELPDARTLTVPADATPLDVAREIGRGLAKAALAGELDGKCFDLRAPLGRGGRFRVITARDPEGGEVIRHSAEHVMADAVKRLWPSTQIDVGRTDHAEKFQYDFDIPVRVGPDELEQIEAEMARIIAEDSGFERQVVSRDEAQRLFEETGERLKVSRLDDIPEGEEITLFRHGDFVDLCRGPHVQRAKQIGAFKLTEVGGSYWRGDESNPMLQRIYGVAFASPKQLDEWLERLEEAKRRDHRRLGAELELFLLHEWAPGAPFFLPKGMRLFNTLCDYVRGLYPKYGYDEVLAPQLFDMEMFRISGHYDMFPDMYKVSGEGDEQIGVKPMNCPGHCLIFQSRKRSYRELPIRLAEFSRLHRNERSGTLLGLTRVRAMSQDDAHEFCEPEQLPDELDRMLAMMREVYADLGLSGVDMYVATRPEQYIGDPDDWVRGERLLGLAGRLRVPDCRRGGGLLRSEDRVSLQGCDRAQVAALDLPDRHGHAGALRPALCRPGRSRAHPGHGASGHPRLARALPGSLPGAHGRRSAALAGPAAGDRAADRGAARGVRLRGPRCAGRGAAPAAGGRAQRDARLPGAGGRDPEGPVHPGGGGPRGARRDGQRAPPPSRGAAGGSVEGVQVQHGGGSQNAWDFVDAAGETPGRKKTVSGSTRTSGSPR